MAYITYPEVAERLGVKVSQLRKAYVYHQRQFKNLKKIGVQRMWSTEEHVPLFKSLLKNNVVGALRQANSKSKETISSVKQKEKSSVTVKGTAKKSIETKKSEQDDTVQWAFSKDGEENENADSVVHYADARTKREYYTALQSKMDYERRMGRLVPADAISDVWKGLAIMTQKALLTIPDRVAPLCVGINDQKIIHNLLKTELRYALKNLSLELKDILPEIETVQIGNSEKTQVIFPQKTQGRGRPNKRDL